MINCDKITVYIPLHIAGLDVVGTVDDELLLGVEQLLLLLVRHIGHLVHQERARPRLYGDRIVQVLSKVSINYHNLLKYKHEPSKIH